MIYEIRESGYANPIIKQCETTQEAEEVKSMCEFLARNDDHSFYIICAPSSEWTAKLKAIPALEYQKWKLEKIEREILNLQNYFDEASKNFKDEMERLVSEKKQIYKE